MKSITLSDLDLPKHGITSNNLPDDDKYTSKFGRRFRNLDFKYIVYIIHNDYMNNVDRFILNKKGKIFSINYY